MLIHVCNRLYVHIFDVLTLFFRLEFRLLVPFRLYSFSLPLRIAVRTSRSQEPLSRLFCACKLQCTFPGRRRCRRPQHRRRCPFVVVMWCCSSIGCDMTDFGVLREVASIGAEHLWLNYFEVHNFQSMVFGWLLHILEGVCCSGVFKFAGAGFLSRLCYQAEGRCPQRVLPVAAHVVLCRPGSGHVRHMGSIAGASASQGPLPPRCRNRRAEADRAAACGRFAGFVVTPFITAVDKASAESAAGRKTLCQSFTVQHRPKGPASSFATVIYGQVDGEATRGCLAVLCVSCVCQGLFRFVS